jgi:hypothetical protein
LGVSNPTTGVFQKLANSFPLHNIIVTEFCNRIQPFFLTAEGQTRFMENESVRSVESWQKAKTDKFWGEVARDEHVLQVYEDHEDLICTLFTFVNDGLLCGDAVVVVATAEHIRSLEIRLRDADHNLFSLRLTDQYIPINASQAISEFMISDTLDPILFRIKALEVMKRAMRHSRRVRVYGEMISLLCAAGNHEGAMQLERLRSEVRKVQPFTLFCGYNSSEATLTPVQFTNIYGEYQRLIRADKPAATEIFFKVETKAKGAISAAQGYETADTLQSPSAG